MVDVAKFIDPTIDPTLQAADRVVGELAKPSQAGPITFSDLGHKCWRRIWYKFRHVSPETPDISSVKRSVESKVSRDLVIGRIKTVCNVQDEGGTDRFVFNDLAGHVTCQIHGIVKGLIQAPKTWHVLSVRSSVKWKGLNKAVRNYGEKQALQEWSDEHYAEAVLSMAASGLTRHYTVISDQGARNWASVRTDANPKFAGYLRAKADKIIFADEAPPKIGDENHFMCRVGFCPMAEVCQHGQLPERHCRTCLHSTPEADGGWSCALGHEMKTCHEHRFLPSLVAGDQVDVRKGDVVYALKSGKEFVDNGKAV